MRIFLNKNPYEKILKFPKERLPGDECFPDAKEKAKPVES